ncbi:MAG: thioredoxin fold domain-containing protein [Gammaproteobacteria bacterium]|nr:thioredoxin fold domain-containing protein [Gammaproteobacteria bacterium]
MDFSRQAAVLAALSLAILCGPGLWAEVRADARADVQEEEEQAVRARLAERLPGMPVSEVRPSPLPGLYTVEMGDGSVLYADAEVSHVIAGDMYALTEAGPVNLAEVRRQERRRELLAAVDPSDLIVFAPQETKAVVNVFTDVDCGYCRKLHQERDELADYGIEVRYLAYPRAGPDSQTYENMVSAWCAGDRQRAITRLKQGESVPAKTCENPVAEQYQLGALVGVSGTPTLVTPTGELIPGYMPAADLAKRLGVL